MRARQIMPFVAGLAVLLLPGSSAAADMFDTPDGTLRHGDYNCTTRNGRVLDGRGFTIIDDFHYAAEKGPGGSYEIKGPKVYFRLGELDGKQVRILSSGRIKYSDDIFCVFAGNPDEMIPETPQPDDKTPPAAPPAPDDGNATTTPPAAPPAGTAPAEPPPEPPPPKVIKVDPNKPDPRLQSVPPP